MVDSFTPNLNLDKPVVGASANTWGTSWNGNADILDVLLAGSITGLQLSAAGSTGSFGIAAGSASGMALPSAYTKGTGAWAVGSGNGSLDTGTIAINSWYWTFIIQRVDTGVCDILITKAVAATTPVPTLPTNYTRYRYIGSLKTDSSSNWLKITQTGDDFILAVPVTDFTGTPGTIASVTYTLPTIPLGVKVTAKIRGLIQAGVSGAASVTIQPFDETAATGPITAIAPTSGFAGIDVSKLTNTSAQIRITVSQTDAAILIATCGWVDTRGKG